MVLTDIWCDVNWLNWREFEWAQSKCLNPSAGSVNQFLLWRKHSSICILQRGSTSCLASKNKKLIQGENSFKELECFFSCLLISCKDLSFSRKDQLTCPAACLKSLGKVEAAEVNLGMNMLFILCQRLHPLSLGVHSQTMGKNVIKWALSVP